MAPVDSTLWHPFLIEYVIVPACGRLEESARERRAPQMETSGREIFWSDPLVSKQDRRGKKGHGSAVLWLTGLPASGKSTISRELDRVLHERGLHTYILDGDNIRHGLNKDLGFSKNDRAENIRRIAEVSKLFVDAGILVICAFVSPYRKDRAFARSIVEPAEFIEVFVRCPVEVCARRDRKGLYEKAFAGRMPGMTGVNDPYEEAEAPEIVLDTDCTQITECVDVILRHLEERRLI